MGESCCQNKAKALEALRKKQRVVLWIVLLINLVMFGVEFWAGLQAASLSLTGDSLDMLGDALVYGSSLYVLGMGTKAQARSALFKGGIMFLTAIAVFARATYQLFTATVPEVSVMSAIGVLALIANLVCLALLTRHRNDNINMSSVWICSRNDIIANTSVLIAAALVAWSGTFWPDFAVGMMLTGVFAKSAGTVLSKSWREFHQAA